jgi:hypothetical protein
MKKLLFILLLSFAGLAGMAQTTYYWVGGAGPVSFTVNSNWNTALNGSGSTRSAAAATDILIIDGTNIGGTTPTVGTVTATVTSTTLSQLKLTGNANVVFLRPTGGGGTGTMTVGGNAAGDDFTIDAGSTLSVNSATADGSVVIALGTAATGSISGNLTVGNTGQNRITNQTAGGMVFNSGSTFTTNLTPASAAYAFGSSSQSVEKSVIFLSGSNIIYNGGYSPFGNNSTFSAIDLRPGSNWYHRATNLVTGQGSFSAGKAYGNIFVENSATYQCDGPLYRIGNLNIASGASFITHTSGQTSVLGDLIVNGTYTVPATIGNVLVMGNTGTQNISGSGTLNAPAITIGDNSKTVLNRNIAVATSLNVFGSINFNNFQVTGAGTFNSRVNNTSPSLAGTLASGSYQITGIPANTIGTINGLTITATGIPANTTVVGSSPANGTINLSQPITTAGAAVNLNFLSDTATLTTSHLNGMDTLSGSVVVIGAKTFSPGTNYIINAATTTPFGISTGSTGTTINAGFVDINAAVTANRSVEIDEHFGVNGKFSLRPLDTLRILTGAVINGTPGTTKYIATLSDATTGNRSLVQYAGISAATLSPTGSAANYLPATITPASLSAFNVAVFEGITTNGAVNGTPLTAAQKLGVVNAVWNIDRISGTGSANIALGWQTALEGSLFITLPNSDIGVIYNTGTSYSTPLGTGDNTANTAAATVSTFGVFSVGSVPQTNPFIFNTLPPKVYGNPDFNTGVVSLNTTQPVTYSSSNTAVATVLPGNIVHITGAGSTDITASQAGDGFYPAASITRTLTVSKAALTAKADTITKFFSQAVPPLTYTVTGFVLGETQAALLTPVTVSTTGTASSPVGNYPIVISGATSNNYAITFIDAVLKVLPQTTQTITFNAPAVKTYGNADFAANATSTNNTIPVTLTSSNPAVATIVGTNIHITGAGTSTITASQAGSIGFTPAPDVARTLTVNKANLAIKVRDTLKTQGQPNPPFTITYTGFVLGETAANLLTPATVTTDATDISSPGYYTLTPVGATSNNYNITYTNGRLTILPLTGNSEQYLNAFLINNSRLTVRVYSPVPRLADITLYNIAGQPVARKNLFMPAGFINSDLFVTALPSGTYVVTVKGNGVDLKKTILIMKH